MDTSPLPLCDFPQVIVDKVFEKWSIPQVFTFSLASEKCRTVARSSRISVQSFEWKVSDYQTEISIGRRGYGETIFSLEWTTFRPWMWLEQELKTGRKPFGLYKTELDGRPMFVEGKADPDKKSIMCRPYIDPRRKDFVDIVSERLLDFMHVEAFHLKVKDIYISPWILNLNRHFTTLDFQCRWILSSEQLTGLMENLSADKFVLKSSVVDGFQYKRPLRHKRMTVSPAKWVSIESLLSMECQRLELIGATLTSADMNSFFKTWQKGELPKLKHLKLTGVQYGVEVLEGIKDDMAQQGSSTIKNISGSVGKLTLSGSRLEFEVDKV